jgi:branched-chain amino acid transport system ATP-binding protein
MELSAEGITVRFGGVTAVDDVALTLRPREILGLIGPNGAGKTTLVNVLSGFQRPQAGRVTIGGTDCTGLARHRFGREGVARSFQAVRLFRGLSVAENVEVGCVASGLGRAAARKRARELLAWIGLADKAEARASGLSYGDERRVGLLRALALEPRFLLLDEPAAGLNAAEADELRAFIGHIQDRFDCAVLLIEHNVALVMTLCQRIHVLDGGRTIAVGTPAEVRAEPAVRRAYLGAEGA